MPNTDLSLGKDYSSLRLKQILESYKEHRLHENKKRTLMINRHFTQIQILQDNLDHTNNITSITGYTTKITKLYENQNNT